MPAIVSLKNWPVYLQRIWGKLSIQDVDAMQGGLAAAYERRQHFVNLNDARGSGVPDAMIRKRLADLGTQIASDTELLLAVAVVLNSQLLVGALTAIQWALPKQKRPLRHFKTAEAALVWLETMLPDGETIPSLCWEECREQDRLAKSGVSPSHSSPSPPS